MKKIDVRGFACPEPVIMVSNVIKSTNDTIKVIADESCAAKNIEKYAMNNGKKVNISKEGSDYIIIIE